MARSRPAVQKEAQARSNRGKVVEFAKGSTARQREPKPPFPEQHQRPPGIEAEIGLTKIEDPRILVEREGRE